VSIRLYHHTFGCKLNFAETHNFISKLNNVIIATEPEKADIAFINSCSVTQAAGHKTLRFVRHLKRQNPDIKIILAGCLVDYLKKQGTLAVDAADILLDNSHKQQAAQYVNSLVHSQRSNADSIVMPDDAPLDNSRTRYFIAVENGCDNFCSYCIIPFLRGHIKSRSADDILNEFNSAVAQGYREFVITGIHIGHYGRDTNSSLAELLELLLQQHGIFRIRLSSIEVNEITPRLLKVLADPRVCRHLHIPLQSGSNTVLSKMNRRYTTVFFGEKVNEIRSSLGDIGITTDVISGFPGEDEQLFNETVDFIKKIGFTRLHNFPFSAMKGTAAYNIKEGIVPPQEIKRRVRKLNELNEQLKLSYIERNIGKKRTILYEKSGRGAYTGNYIHVFPAKNYLKNRFYSGIIINKEGEFKIEEEVDAVYQSQINW